MLRPAFHCRGNLGLAKSFLHEMWPCTPHVEWGRSCSYAPTASLRASQEKDSFAPNQSSKVTWHSEEIVQREKGNWETNREEGPVTMVPKCGMQFVHPCQGLGRPSWEPIQVLRERDKRPSEWAQSTKPGTTESIKKDTTHSLLKWSWRCLMYPRHPFLYGKLE